MQKKTIKEQFQDTVLLLKPAYGEREASSVSRIIFEDAFGISNFFSDQLFDHSDQLEEIIKRLLKGEPIQYILEQAHFYGFNFKVSPLVLIPRPETEELVFWILECFNNRKLRVLDIGTGSGCIPIVLKKKRPLWTIYGLDISKDALEIARENAQLNQVEISFLQLNILDKTSWESLPSFDLIISNPPYIPPSEKEWMPHQVLHYEPGLALFVPEEDPLIFYKSIANLGKEKLLSEGCLFFEVNEFQASKVVQLLTMSEYNNIVLQKDMSGKDRMIKASLQETVRI